ncbi:MAG: bifunctional enoyl-CoA hydratase/phosphate acetyltransferase [Bacteroidales bacterium]|nr:bifunctional enoyl-CoA hydratase/phosphate acetyltransferase [Candidatus Colimorpha onthohippi]
MVTKLDDLLELVKTKGKKRLVAAYANDSHTIGAVSMAVDRGIVDAILVGDIETIKKVCAEENIDVNKFELVQEADETKAGVRAVELINEGRGDVLMKGLLSTDKYMRAILNKEKGLMPGKKTDMLTHMAVFQIPKYHKLLVCSDVAIVPAPDMKQKQAILGYLISTAKSLEIAKPKVALLAATEQVSTGMNACVEAAIISKMGDRGQIKGAILDGPLALDVAIDKESAQTKKVGGEVAGDADCILFPNIESGNVFYKACTKFGGAELACMVVGAKVPCVLTSRGDSINTKLYSIALAALNAR